MASPIGPTHNDHRDFLRCQVPAGYCEVRVRTGPTRATEQVGHCYNLSASGIRFELDRPLPCGEEVAVELFIPKPWGFTVRASGQIVRYHEPDETGPVRMGLIFTEFADPYARFLIDWYVRDRLTSPPVEAAA